MSNYLRSDALVQVSLSTCEFHSILQVLLWRELDYSFWATEEEATGQSLQAFDGFVNIARFPQVGYISIEVSLLRIRMNLEELQ